MIAGIVRILSASLLLLGAGASAFRSAGAGMDFFRSFSRTHGLRALAWLLLTVGAITGFFYLILRITAFFK